MSTSSSRKGACSRCGHQMNDHAELRDSKCKKCKKIFDICQAMYHGQGDEGTGGWRICYVPCNCGAAYYPDKANAARQLEPHEYLPGHPGYRPLEPDYTDTAVHDTDYSTAYDISSDIITGDITDPERDDQLTDGPGAAATGSSHARYPSQDSEDPLSWHSTPGPASVAQGGPRTGHVRAESQSSEDPLTAPVSSLADMLAHVDIDDSQDPQPEAGEIVEGEEEAIYVETEVKHKKVRFEVRGQKFKTELGEWQEISADDGTPYYLFTSESGEQFWTTELGSTSHDQASGSKSSGKNKDKQGGKKKHRKGK